MADAVIESLIKRKGGSTITLGTNTYAFKDNGKGAHVAVVDDPDDAKRLLAIKEGYRLYNPKAKPAPVLSGGDQQIVTLRNNLIAEFQRKFSKDPAPDITIEELQQALEDGTGA